MVRLSILRRNKHDFVYPYGISISKMVADMLLMLQLQNRPTFHKIDPQNKTRYWVHVFLHELPNECHMFNKICPTFKMLHPQFSVGFVLLVFIWFFREFCSIVYHVCLFGFCSHGVS